jgi:hypothetical protein
VTDDDARRLVAALAVGRDQWLADIVPTLRAEAVWLVPRESCLIATYTSQTRPGLARRVD